MPRNVVMFMLKTCDIVDEKNKTLLHHDEYINYLNTISNKDVYNYYLKLIKFGLS